MSTVVFCCSQGLWCELDGDDHGDLPSSRDRPIREQASLLPLGEVRVRTQASRRKMAVAVLSASIVMVALKGSTTSGVAPVQLTPIRSVLPLGFRHSPPSPFVQGEGCSRRRQESTSPSQAVNVPRRVELPAVPIPKAPQVSLVRLCPRGLGFLPALCAQGLILQLLILCLLLLQLHLLVLPALQHKQLGRCRMLRLLKCLLDL